jgi:hypothetical protein
MAFHPVRGVKRLGGVVVAAGRSVRRNALCLAAVFLHNGSLGDCRGVRRRACLEGQFPVVVPADHGGGDGIAQDVGGGASHVQELIDHQQDANAGGGDAEGRDDGGDHHE